MTKRKRIAKSLNAIEKVELTENLIMCYDSGIAPEAHEIKRARELGIDIEALEKVQGDGSTSSY
jgi:hypothetical protein